MIDQITFDEFGRANVRHKMPDGSYHRQILEPGDAMATDPQTKELKPLEEILGAEAAKVNAKWTPETVAAYEAAIEAQKK